MRIAAWLKLLRAGPNAQRGAAPPTEPAVEIGDAGRNAFEAGLSAYAAKDFAAAIACFASVIERRHDDSDAHNNLGLCYLETGQVEDAVDSFVLAIHFKPDFPEAFHHLALAALQADDYQEAVRCLERALELNPDFAAGHSSLGYLLTHRTGEFERGAAHIRTALRLKPADPDILCNYSAVLTQEGGSEEALIVCEKLLDGHPQMHEARLNRALALLKCGRFDEGWRDYEARKLARGNYIPRALPFQEWHGEPLADAKLLIYAEQGLGDQIMFASCVPEVLNVTKGCLLECAPSLTPLFRRSFDGVNVTAQTQHDANLVRIARDAGITHQTAIGSLPAQFRKCGAQFPKRTGYLRADPARIACWKRRLDALGPGIKVGFSWAGGTASTRGASRSMQLAEWAPIFAQEHCHFVNLQYGNIADELPAFSRAHKYQLHDWRDANAEYEDTAALVAAVDLVITVQTALVHLAGALGKPAWVMLPAASEWRYAEHGESMPWYPSVRLFRQPHAGDWQAVVALVAHELSRRAV
jgi:Flp pilus assembly protein TadD